VRLRVKLHTTRGPPASSPKCSTGAPAQEPGAGRAAGRLRVLQPQGHRRLSQGRCRLLDSLPICRPGMHNAIWRSRESWEEIPYFIERADVAETTYRPSASAVRCASSSAGAPDPGSQLALVAIYDYHALSPTGQARPSTRGDHRRHAVVEDVIRDLSTASAEPLAPLGALGKPAWLVLNALAHNLGRWCAPRARSRVAPDDDKDAPHALFDRAGSDDELRKAQAPSTYRSNAVEDQFNTCLENLRRDRTAHHRAPGLSLEQWSAPRNCPVARRRPSTSTSKWALVRCAAVVRKNTSESP